MFMSEQQDSKQDESMEEILKSIKRIIADDEAVENVSEKKSAEVRPSGLESTILELTELVQTESVGADVLSAIDAKLEVATPATPANHKDILDNIDSLISSEAATATSNALHNFKHMQHNMELPQIPQAPLGFRSGTTIEDLVIEALKPELRDWLNANLPSMVERMVAAEIKKIAGN
jgi:cell pole-organizing protein PopZ